MKLRLLFVINQLNKGGAEQSLVNLLRRLPADKYEIDLLVYDHVYFSQSIDLFEQLPPWIRVCNASQNERGFSILKKIYLRIVKKILGRQVYRQAAIEFVKGSVYDIAISDGEWFAPDFVTDVARARNKAVWVHNDLAAAEYFQPASFFRQYEIIDRVLFVSRQSMQKSIAAYPFLRDKAVLIHNTVDDDDVRQAAAETVEWPFQGPVVLTVNNVRPQKNHLRQVEVMRRLARAGHEFTWLNIGSKADRALVEQIRSKIRQYRLEERFLLLGPKSNPYAYMRKADIIAVLSDYESWSMVITEAKALAKPILSTRTSGAIEQIQDGETGILADFDAGCIAGRLARLLTDADLRARLQQNLRGYRSGAVSVGEFDAFAAGLTAAETPPPRPRLLYIIDNVNYRGGAHQAAMEQIQYLIETGNEVTVFSNEPPDCTSRSGLVGCRFASFHHIKGLEMLNESTRRILFASNYSWRQKMFRFKLWLTAKLRRVAGVNHPTVRAKTAAWLEKFDAVCVMSEGSMYRALVAGLRRPKKIQWIHTDYEQWSQYIPYTRAITRKDRQIYRTYDHIVFVSEAGRGGFVARYPELAGKTRVIKNLLPVEKIKRLALQDASDDEADPLFRIVTVGRLEPEKALERAVAVAGRLKAAGYRFTWDIIGDGYLKSALEQQIAQNGLTGRVKLRGYCANPYPLLRRADVFALLSLYEGLPNTIYEAFLLGVPVIATRVGGVAEQIDGRIGWLVDNDADSIYQGLARLLANPDLVAQARCNLGGYQFDLSGIRREISEVFTVKTNLEGASRDD